SVALSCLCLSAPPATPNSHSLSLHDSLPIYTAAITASVQPHVGSATSMPVNTKLPTRIAPMSAFCPGNWIGLPGVIFGPCNFPRSEEHTSELQSRENLVCRLLLEKKNRQASN